MIKLSKIKCHQSSTNIPLATADNGVWHAFCTFIPRYALGKRGGSVPSWGRKRTKSERLRDKLSKREARFPKGNQDADNDV